MDQPRNVAKNLRERAARISGPGPRIIRQGEVWTVSDDLIVLPEERAGKPRTLHEERFVVVLQESATTPYSTTICVAPCSASHGPGPFDVEFEEPPNGFSKPVTVFVSLLQPILVDDLKRRSGIVDVPSLHTIGMKVVQLFGLAGVAELQSTAQK